jgi:hypothetical protein
MAFAEQNLFASMFHILDVLSTTAPMVLVLQIGHLVNALLELLVAMTTLVKLLEANGLNAMSLHLLSLILTTSLLPLILALHNLSPLLNLLQLIPLSLFQLNLKLSKEVLLLLEEMEEDKPSSSIILKSEEFLLRQPSTQSLKMKPEIGSMLPLPVQE